MRVKDIVKLIDKWAPFATAAQWDNVGLQLGNADAAVSKVVVALDLTEEVVATAADQGAELIVTHHPLFFKPLNNLTTDTQAGKLALEASRLGINVVAAHTNLDVAEGGVSFLLAERLGLVNHKVLVETFAEKLFKLAVFVPEDYQDQVRAVLGEAGAGFIGNYSHCTFNTPGIGTFKPEAGAQPFLGELDRLEQVAEVKIETIVPQNLLSPVLNKMLEAHPYEEVAYDLFPLANKGYRLGFGRVGRLAEPVGTEEFLVKVKKSLDCGFLRIAGYLPKQIGKVAVLGGSGADFIRQASRAGADAYVTADLKYHQAQVAEDLGLLLVDPGHDVTEQLIVPALTEYLQDQIKVVQGGVEVYPIVLPKPMFTVF